MENDSKERFTELLRLAVAKGVIEWALRKVHRACRRLISFDDFLNETITHAIAKNASFSGLTEGELVNWIKKIGQRLMIDLLRRSKKRLIEPLPLYLQDKSISSPDIILSQFEDMIWLESAMRQLDTREREIVRLYYFEHVSWVDIAKKLNMKYNTLIKTHGRIIGKLRDFRDRTDSSLKISLRLRH